MIIFIALIWPKRSFKLDKGNSDWTLFRADFVTFDWIWRSYRLFIYLAPKSRRQIFFTWKPYSFWSSCIVITILVTEQRWDSFMFFGWEMNDLYFCRCRILSIYDINDWLHTRSPVMALLHITRGRNESSRATQFLALN